MRSLYLGSIGVLLAACGDAAPPPARVPATAPAPTVPTTAASARQSEAVPRLELPADVRAVREQVELYVDPTSPTFNGTVNIELALTAPRDVLWLHGRGLHVTLAAAHVGGKKIAGRWEEADPSGVAKVSFDTPLPAGPVVLHVEWDAPYVKGTKGLYVTTQSGRAYAATQFEAIDARRAFPCFDQPSAKIPFEVTLVVPPGNEAISNGKEASRTTEGSGRVRVRFAPTPPISSYLVAFAVGPYDVVKAADIPPSALRTTPIPLRGVAAKGRGPELAYAMANAGAIVGKLEEYFGVPYPYEKLDLLAIPDREGAMENAGAVMFSEDGLLLDPKTASDGQLRGFGQVVTHELAHQWFGDLVTMAWWNDLWLNEAFATWTAAKIGDVWDPKVRSGLNLLEGVQGAMGSDALASARAIRQPIATNDDIENGFDGITYQKGAGVIRMFERWVGEDAFRRGVHAHFEAHRFGNATSDEFLAAISKAAGKDVGTPFHTFLDRPGVPFVEVASTCDGAPRLHVKQSRYLPLGSTADANVTWKIPFCARYAVKGAAKETCALVEAAGADVPLEGCPDWVMPNARAGGYYRFSLAPADLGKLRKAGLKELDVSERIAFGNSLRASYRRAALPYGDILEAASALATDPHAEVANEPAGFLGSARQWFLGDPVRPKVEAYGARLFGPVAKGLGYEPTKGEDVARGALRRDVLYFMADHAKDPTVRAELAKRGRAYLGSDGALHPDAVTPNLATLALRVWAEGGDESTFTALRAALAKTEDATARSRLLIAAASIRAPAGAEQGRQLSLDPSLRTSEMLTPLWTQFGNVETREAAWTWMKASYDPLFARLKDVPFGPTQLIYMTRNFCDEARADDVKAFFEPRVAAFDGGPRELAAAVEDIRLCAKVRAAHQSQAKTFFEHK